MNATARALVDAARELATDVDRLHFAPPVAYVYDPLVYARAAHEQFITRFVHGPRATLLVGMNPGPFGMAQTGVPFGEVSSVRGWMGIDAKVGRPPREHPKRPIQGFACSKSEVSGARLWGAIAMRFPDARDFFATHFVANYCPLVFMDEGGKNLTPDKLPKAERAPLEAACDAHLDRVVRALAPAVVLGVGAWAAKCCARVVGARARVATLPHPSPASPAANAGWAALARRALKEQEIVPFL
ncbi:MAG: single-stranded DNA-binding protein [Deltaproteobacteria bacterium]|nr:single-stranded DNA-binding protein [Deltaproteobacteria bacterium]